MIWGWRLEREGLLCLIEVDVADFGLGQMGVVEEDVDTWVCQGRNDKK